VGGSVPSWPWPILQLHAWLHLRQREHLRRSPAGTPGTTPGCNVGYEFATGNSGNPQLDPYRATQFNIAWEDYFAPQALVSVGGFYKQIESFEISENVPTLVPDDFGGTVGPINQPVNGGHGYIYGAEFAGQYVFDMGFGVAAQLHLHSSPSRPSRPRSAPTCRSRAWRLTLRPRRSSTKTMGSTLVCRTHGVVRR